MNTSIQTYSMWMMLLFFMTVIIFSTGCARSADLSLSADTNRAATSAEHDISPPEPSQEQLQETIVLPILGFHHVGSAPAGTSAEARQWYISEDTLSTILDNIEENGYTPITASALIDAFDSNVIAKKPILLTFDDGNRDFYTTVFPIIKQRNIPVTLAIMTGVGGNTYVTKEQLVEMHNSGLVDIQSHTKYHAYLTKVSPQEREQELRESKEFIETLLHKKAEALIYPFGLYNEAVIADAKRLGYKIGITITNGKTQSLNAPFELKRYLVVEQSNIAELLAE